MAVPAAYAEEFRPAALTGTSQSLEKRIRFPKGAGDVQAWISCDGLVSAKGALLATYCLAPDNGLVAYEKAIALAAARAVFSPALVDGVARDVLVQYRVEFERRSGVEQVRVYLNPGLQTATYGAGFSAPQRLDPRSEYVFSPDCPRRMRLWAAATITEEGRPVGVTVESNGAGGKNCREFLLDRLQRARFIPAFVDGRPVRAQYREVFFGDGRFRPPGRRSSQN